MFGKLYYKTVACQSTVQATHNFKQLLQTSYPPEKQKVNYITSYLEKALITMCNQYEKEFTNALFIELFCTDQVFFCLSCPLHGETKKTIY